MGSVTLATVVGYGILERDVQLRAAEVERRELDGDPALERNCGSAAGLGQGAAARVELLPDARELAFELRSPLFSAREACKLRT